MSSTVAISLSLSYKCRNDHAANKTFESDESFQTEQNNAIGTYFTVEFEREPYEVNEYSLRISRIFVSSTSPCSWRRKNVVAEMFINTCVYFLFATK